MRKRVDWKKRNNWQHKLVKKNSYYNCYKFKRLKKVFNHKLDRNFRIIMIQRMKNRLIWSRKKIN